MTPFDPALRRSRIALRARLLYELGGVRLGLLAAWPVLPLYLLSSRCCGPQLTTQIVTAILFVAAVALVAASRELGRAVRLGLLSGGLCAAIPIGMKLLQIGCIVGCRSLAQFCLYGGLLAGAILGYRVCRVEARRPRFFLVAGGIAGLSGALGCIVAGVSGVLGMGLGVAMASTPFLLAAARAR